MRVTAYNLVLILFVSLLLRPTSVAAEVKVQRPASERFATANTAEVPDFQRHVVPLLGRLGCNGRSCHGSFQGRGDFRLSLFGYDFAMDHAALTGLAASGDGSRVDVDAADESLIIRKPALELDHEGGQRFALGTWEHHLLRRWIESGVAGIDAPRELKRLVVEPHEVVFRYELVPVQLRVVAVWQDGEREDVTELCRFRTNDDSVVTVDQAGLLRSTGRGDTHVVAFYDNGVAALPVMRAMFDLEETGEPPGVAATKIDHHVQTKLAKLAITPSAISTDAEFLRRVSIDLTGTLPTPAEVGAFLSDQTIDKRRLKIDELLERPAYAAWWANKLCDFTGCNPSQQAELGQETSVQWYMWILERIRENIPYDELVERIVMATSRDVGQSYDAYAEEVTAYFRDEEPADFATRTTMPHYWTRRSMEEPEGKALAFAHSFLGIRMQCAQCHKHPFAPWTQEDFEQFKGFFKSVRYGVKPDADLRYRELAEQVGLELRGDNGAPVRKNVLSRADAGRPIPWRELFVAEREEAETLSLLRSRSITIGADDDPRTPIMNWMKDPENPWFARAFVNRVWAGYFSVGIIDPPDDLNPANPPSNPELLDWLSSAFIEGGYDMKWLHREIVASDAYQRSWKPNESNRDDRRHFSRAIPRRIPAEVVYDGLKQVTAGTDQLEEVRTDLTRRAIGHLSMRMAGTYAMHVFGKPERAVNCDCERVNQPTLLQAVFLQNDPLVEQRLAASGWIRELAKTENSGAKMDSEAIVREAWLRTISRPPTDAEIDRAVQHLRTASSRAEGARDLLWALINTKEFVLNR